ncbi:hypothetical protein R1sor_025474 [Riccia sorocarpa]|uniref:Uncharacterized protein n=1 Tax=Riccia sorocarpa TaxID=122646 RepID=A0ABD3GA96_9MARC
MLTPKGSEATWTAGRAALDEIALLLRERAANAQHQTNEQQQRSRTSQTSSAMASTGPQRGNGFDGETLGGLGNKGAVAMKATRPEHEIYKEKLRNIELTPDNIRETRSVPINQEPPTRKLGITTFYQLPTSSCKMGYA